MATKNQIARRMYDESFEDLYGGQKAAVTRAFNNQTSSPVRASPRASRTGSAHALVKFARPGVNGVKECAVEANTTVEEALSQGALKVNSSKEGIITKDGASVSLSDAVKDGETYLIVPGVDSSN